ncbi:hypothetical protein QUS22_01305 [Wolbachia pipientis]|nr:hypothetical protein [Wolbachia pipientis]
MKKLEKRISNVIKGLNNYNDLVREVQYPAIHGSNNDFIQLTKIAGGLSAAAGFEFVDKEKLPDTSLEVQSTSRVGILSWLGSSSYLCI